MFQPFRQFLETELNFRFDLQPQPIPSGLDIQVSDRSKDRIIIQNWCYSCPQLRKIRYTYINAGENGQTFNSIIYPDYHYDLPILSIDCLALGKQKMLVTLDFQPIWTDVGSDRTKRQYQKHYIEPMRAIWDKYPNLNQHLKFRSYDANNYFSPYLIFARVDAETLIQYFFPAYQQYVQLYCQLVQKSQPLLDQQVQTLVEAHSNYDQYHAGRDRAHKMLTSYFGSQWANRFLYEFLFDRAVPVSEIDSRLPIG